MLVEACIRRSSNPGPGGRDDIMMWSLITQIVNCNSKTYPIKTEQIKVVAGLGLRLRLRLGLGLRLHSYIHITKCIL